jgi:hypothetical protein
VRVIVFHDKHYQETDKVKNFSFSRELAKELSKRGYRKIEKSKKAYIQGVRLNNSITEVADTI